MLKQQIPPVVWREKEQEVKAEIEMHAREGCSGANMQTTSYLFPTEEAH